MTNFWKFTNFRKFTSSGGTAVLLSPSTSGGTFAAYTGLAAIGAAVNVDAFHQPWWSSPGSTCTLAYNTSLVRDRMGLRGSFVPFPFAELITNATAYVLDNVTLPALHGVQVHLRNVPVDSTDKTSCNGGNGCGAQTTTVSNQALVFEAPLLQSKAVTDSADADLEAKGATAVVCGLDIFNASVLPKSPQARWVFATLIDYALDAAPPGPP